MSEYLVIHDARFTMTVEADTPLKALAKARNADPRDWQLGDQDELEIYDENGLAIEDWSWIDLENELEQGRG